MDDPLTLFALLVVFCTRCGSPLMIAGMTGYAFLVDLPRKKKAVAQLAEGMGLTLADDPRRESDPGKVTVTARQKLEFAGFHAR